MSFKPISEEEYKLIEKLRTIFAGCMKEDMYQDDYTFVRFLRARDHNINAAEKMLRNHLNIRKIHRIDTMLTDFTPHEVARKYISLGRIGYDNEGLPVIYSNFGTVDPRGLIRSMKLVDISRFFMHLHESIVADMNERSKKSGKLMQQWILILDFKNFSLSTATHKESLDVFMALVKMYEDNCPERLKACYVINGSLYFQIGFAVIKSVMSGATIKKVQVYGKDGWKEELLKIIDKQILPAFLGGTRTDPDGNPLCNTFINLGGIVPESYYLKKKKISDFALSPGVKKLYVSRMSKEELYFDVLFPGSNLEYEFETKHKDISFALLFKENQSLNGETEELIPKTRVDAHIYSEGGLIKCEKPGIYILEFDNSYSWIRSKEVYWKASVVSPQNQNLVTIS